MPKIFVIVATDQKNGIGKDGVMPWHLSKELRYFAKLTTKTKDPKRQNMLIMGRTTWLSLPKKFRPLKNRINVVLSRSEDFSFEGAVMARSFDEAFAKAGDQVENIFIIGGATIYRQAIEQLSLTGIYKTEIHSTFDCDTFFPAISSAKYTKKVLSTETEKDLEFDFCYYELNS